LTGFASYIYYKEFFMKKVVVFLLCAALCAAISAQNAGDFKTDGRGTITNYEGWDTVITVPAQIGGTAVTAIGDGAFKNMGITRLTLPAGIRSIGDEAFRDNKLTSLTIPNSVTYIGSGAFSNNQLASITVGNGVWIGSEAFYSNKLTSLTLPAGIFVGERAFYRNQLTSLTVGNGVYIDNGAFASNQLASLTVGNGVTIGSSAFSYNQLTGVTVGDGCFITGNPFYGNDSLKNLVLGADIFIQRGTFSISAYYDYMCNSRKAGTYDNTVRYNERSEGDYWFVLTKYGAVIIWYTGNEGSRLDIPARLGGAAVTGIGWHLKYGNRGDWTGAFQQESVSRIRLPEGLVFIGDYAFYGNQLTDVTIPNSVTSIGVSAFSRNQLTSVTIPNSVTYLSGFGGNKLTSVTIPNSVTSIGNSAFYGNQLTSVTIGANVELKTGTYASFGNNFEAAYNNGGMQAGTYTRNGSTWTRQ
jgi:acetyltransferase-like isoleucine patch superfamily enzyme